MSFEAPRQAGGMDSLSSQSGNESEVSTSCPSSRSDEQTGAVRDAMASRSPGGTQGPRSRHSTRVERFLLERLAGVLRPGSWSISLWDGFAVGGQAAQPAGSIEILDRPTLWRLLYWPDFSFPECYARGSLRIKGDLTDLIRSLHRLLRDRRDRQPGPPARARSIPHLGGAKVREQIWQHYDIGNDFYQLWLDRQLLYTCAYFESSAVSLEEAQIAKMDLVCRKLRLRPGDEVIEAGCGWGALALHMARDYGARVRAFNISREQLAYARDRAAREGLSDRVTFVEADWRDIAGKCDAFVSVGMLEHVRPENYTRLGRIIRSCLRPDTGRGLIHTIGQKLPEALNAWIERRIFPGAQPPTLAQMMTIFETSGHAVIDVENLRSHYAETLRHWLERFDRHEPEVRAMFDDKFVRAWRMYLASSQAAFETGELELFQVLFAPPTSTTLPATRRDIYTVPAGTR